MPFREPVREPVARWSELYQASEGDGGHRASYPGVVKTYTIQAGRELRVIVGAEKLSDMESESLSHDIAKKIQDEMTYPGR